MDSPFTIFFLSVAIFWISAQSGLYLRKHQKDLQRVASDDLVLLLTATLTLLALIIGFTFAMALGEYDQRRTSEQTEASAIGTEYARASLLQDDYTKKIRKSLREYLQQRILFYASHSPLKLSDVNRETTRLQTELWSVTEIAGKMKPDPIGALVISGMNDVFSSETSALAARFYRIPLEAWILMEVIAICGNLLMGYTAKSDRIGAKRFWVLPLMVSIALFLIADLDNPRHGIIWINPQNLIYLSQSM